MLRRSITTTKSHLSPIAVYSKAIPRISNHSANSRQPLRFQGHHLFRPFSSNSKTLAKMSSDDAYASFLEKANQDTSSSTTQQAKKDTGFAQTKSVDTDVPAQLKSVTGESSELFYMSETDEPFEAVALGFEKGAELSVDAFAKLIGTKSSDIEESSLSSWNVKGAYNDVVDAVKKAVGGGEVGIKVFRVAHESTRCEYFVVGVNSQGAVVGVKAKAVET